VVNVHNFNDNRCFQWAVLSCLYPPKSHPNSVYSYTKYANTLNFDDISFPISLKDISKFMTHANLQLVYHAHIKSVVKVEILRWGNCTCTLGPCQCMWAPCWQLYPARWSLNRRVFIHLLQR